MSAPDNAILEVFATRIAAAQAALARPLPRLKGRAPDPEREQARGRPLRPVDFLGLAERGITGGRLAWPSPGVGGVDLLMRDAVLFGRGGRFEFARLTRGEVAPESAYTVLARDRGGEACDVVAWHPRTGRIASWLGRAGLVGEDHACAETRDDPLPVFPDLGTWLASDRRGVVVVIEQLARPVLLAAGALQAADLAHGEALDAMLRKVRVPTILVPETVRAAA